MADDFEARANNTPRSMLTGAGPGPLVEKLASRRPEVAAMLHGILADAVSTTGAHKGNIQILEPASESLRIAASIGFGQPFLDFFAVVRDDSSACGVALKRGGRVIVNDVATSPIFLGTPALEVMMNASCLSVQSTPLISDDRLVGVLSTHRYIAWTPSPSELGLIDDYARRAAAAITTII